MYIDQNLKCQDFTQVFDVLSAFVNTIYYFATKKCF